MTRVGDRVSLVSCSDPHTRLEPGELGTVRLIDGTGTVHVDWDSGSKLGLIREAGDAWTVVPPKVTVTEAQAVELRALGLNPQDVEAGDDFGDLIVDVGAILGLDDDRADAWLRFDAMAGYCDSEEIVEWAQACLDAYHGDERAVRALRDARVL